MPSVSYVRTFEAYVDAVVQEAADRQNKYIRTVDEYFTMRRDTSAVKPCFALLELDLNLTQEVIDHPVIKEMETLGTDMVTLANVSSHNAPTERDTHVL